MSASTSPGPSITIGGGSDISEGSKVLSECERLILKHVILGIMSMIRPSVQRLDEHVKTTRISQITLATELKKLSEYLKTISDNQKTPFDLEKYVRKLADAQTRVSNAAARLTAMQERMSALQRGVARERMTLSRLRANDEAAESVDVALR